MIEQSLFFAAGAFTVALLWLLLMPILWRRAMRLSYVRLEQALPMSVNDILAEQDRLRASHAVELGRMEQISARHLQEIARAKAKLGDLIIDKMNTEGNRQRLSEQVEQLQAGNNQLEDMLEKQREMLTTLLTLLVIMQAAVSKNTHNLPVQQASAAAPKVDDATKDSRTEAEPVASPPAYPDILSLPREEEAATTLHADKPAPQSKDEQDLKDHTDFVDLSVFELPEEAEADQPSPLDTPSQSPMAEPRLPKVKRVRLL